MNRTASARLLSRLLSGRTWFRLVLPLLLFGPVFSPLAASAARASWDRFAQKPDDWYQSPEGVEVTTRLLSWQTSAGLWPKNRDTTASLSPGPAEKTEGTFDNGASLGELRFLARAFRARRNADGGAPCLAGFQRGLAAVLAAQYPTGGWPQIYPPPRGYHRHITFNDGAMVNVLKFLRDVATSADFGWLEDRSRRAARAAFDRGIDCIVRCQVMVQGEPTVWCAQHDEKDLSPRPARAYELVSLSGSESAGILELLMSLDSPSPAVRRAVRGGVAWFARARLPGVRLETRNGDRVVVEDPAAPPLWARFYEIDTNRPFFCGRDGVKKYRLSEIEAERRKGYAWYGNWGESVARQFATWSARWGPTPSAPAPPSFSR